MCLIKQFLASLTLTLLLFVYTVDWREGGTTTGQWQISTWAQEREGGGDQAWSQAEPEVSGAGAGVGLALALAFLGLSLHLRLDRNSHTSPALSSPALFSSGSLSLTWGQAGGTCYPAEAG